MDLREFHFTQPLWLLLLLMIPCLWGIYFFCYRKRSAGGYQLEKFADAHLIPYLLVGGKQKSYQAMFALCLWSIVWLALTLALAGPRWNFRDIEILAKDQSLVVILDLSESMNAADVKPSRLVRAKQKIEDLINLSEGVKLGLIVFAADPHMITPITEDKETIRRLLPSIGTDLIYIQGSRLSPALEMGATMLNAESGASKAMLVISDGGFEDSSAIGAAKRLAEEGIITYTMGVGGTEGIPMRDKEGNIIKKEGIPVLTKLDAERLSEVSFAGKGRYLESHYTQDAEKILFSEMEKKSGIESKEGQTKRLWDEGFYVFALSALPIMLWWFRRGQLYALAIIFLMPGFSLHAYEYFKNSEQLAKDMYDAEAYAEAAECFQDPYRKGVAYYQAGNFAEAEKMFRESTRPEVACCAAYNLGNALAYQNKLKEAVTAYEEVLNQWPDHVEAKENLELIKKMLEGQEQQQKQQQDRQEKNDKQDQQEKNSQEQNDCEQQSQEQQGQENKENKQQQKQQESPSKDREQEQETPEEKQDQEGKGQQGKENLPEKPQKPNSQSPERPQPDISDEQEEQANFWLDRIENDPKTFLKNKCYIESKKNKTKEGIDPW